MTDTNAKTEDLKKQVAKIQHDTRVVNATAKVEVMKAKLKEAKDGADKAAATTNPTVSIEQNDAEAKRTAILATQAAEDLALAEHELEDVKKTVPPVTPVVPATPAVPTVK